ncbi:MAG TPA: 16S rRNA (cytosine(1402)-N(4))-methyltransferase, partial [Myxococcaceae bacterium]|nr:16S rRNA (cytosine(1402)-N(4))-methyltransferase [Myxococcaceae bacterium]
MSTTEPIRPPVHVPVLLERVTSLLGPVCAAPGAVLVDCTLGLAGHALALLGAHPGLRLVGLDRDPDARAEAGRRIAAAGHSERVTLVPAVFDELPEVLERLGIDEVQGVL